MNVFDIILIAVLFIYVVAASVYYLMRGRKKCCGGDCSRCGMCGCKMRGIEHLSGDKKECPDDERPDTDGAE